MVLSARQMEDMAALKAALLATHAEQSRRRAFFQRWVAWVDSSAGVRLCNMLGCGGHCLQQI